MYVCMYTCLLVNWQGIELIAQHYQHTLPVHHRHTAMNLYEMSVSVCMYVCIHVCRCMYVCIHVCQ